MKVFVHFEGSPDFTQKLQIESDSSLSVGDITKVRRKYSQKLKLQKFVDAYNEKHGSTKLLQLQIIELLSPR